MSVDTQQNRSDARMVSREMARFQNAENQFGQSRNLRFFYEGGPQGYLVDMPADNEVRPHFHAVDQFQVFFGVDGASYQRSPLRRGSVVVHYADGYMTYGPFATTDEPLEFFTLRAVDDNFIAYMPEDRDKLVQKGRRNLHGESELTGGVGLTTGAIEREVLIDQEADNLQSYLLRAGPDTEVTVPMGDTSGQYCCVVGGAGSHLGEMYGPQALGWVERGGAPLVFSTGPDLGIELLVMDFPYPPTVTATGGAEGDA